MAGGCALTRGRPNKERLAAALSALAAVDWMAHLSDDHRARSRAEPAQAAAVAALHHLDRPELARQLWRNHAGEHGPPLPAELRA